MPRLFSRGPVVALLLACACAGSGCGPDEETKPPIDRGQDPDLQKAMGNYMNKIQKPQAKK